MFFTIYKTTNILNGMIYIGLHQTKNLDDKYLGSGKYFTYALKKYGKENFIKEILYVFDNEAEMNAKEKELVTEEFCALDTNYNICIGGFGGGYAYINTNRLNVDLDEQRRRDPAFNKKASSAGNAAIRHLLETDNEFKEKWSKKSSLAQEQRNKLYPNGVFFGKTHSVETRKKLSEADRTGIKNSQFGSMWITNGIENKKIKRDVDIIPEGWYKGRSVRPVGLVV